ncbi:MAG: rubrerythrin family protein [Thermoplasmatota archaeon]
MTDLQGTQTLDNLKAAFAGESQANRRYLYFAERADTEGQEEAASLFRSISNGETKHAFGHLDWLDTDPVTDVPIGDTAKNLKAAIAGEVYEFTEMYPGFARVARDEGFTEIAEWFEVMAKAEKIHAGRFESALEALTGEASGLIPA